LRGALAVLVRLAPAGDERHAGPRGCGARNPRVQVRKLGPGFEVEQNGQRLGPKLGADARGIRVVRVGAGLDRRGVHARRAQGGYESAPLRAVRAAEENDVPHKVMSDE
jgi:hypothetical protein